MQKKGIKIPENYKYISAFLTMRCNLKCIYCLNAFEEDFTRKRQELSGKEWIKALNKIQSRSELPITFSGGEPFLHKDFIYIINNLKPELNINILTNLYPTTTSYKKTLERFVNEINPNRIKRNALYPSIRVSYHPEQMGNGKKLVENVKKLQDKRFSIGIYYVAYPGPRESELFTQMQFRCLDAGIDYRRKDFTGEFEGVDSQGKPLSIIYGDYSKYPDSVYQEKTKSCLCKIHELFMGPNGDVYKCHRDLYAKEFSIGNIVNDNFQIKDEFKECNKYGHCHPCDVKVKTNYKQQLGHTSAEIINIKSK